ncbi:Hisactophilin c49s mutant phototropin phy3 fusion protein [Apiospora aurea]|uniref:Hisactophilin c49s mutant phototropin phy3 fusion protein n=1 Tax=Apiospora aurea TaxID=335848 RepID=A0ABR1Q1C7_9PEZI
MAHATDTNTATGTSEDLPELQVAAGEPEGLDPLENEELEPGSFDLVSPGYQEDGQRCKYELETRSDLLFSRRHLQSIFDDPTQLRRFSSFLYEHRPASIALLKYYLGLLKALRAIEYSNSVAQMLKPPPDTDVTQHDGESGALPTTYNQELQTQADLAFDHMTREDLPMYITHVWIKTVSVSVKHRIMGTLPHVSEGLAEVFCLTDPSRPDNPIVFTSDEFHRTTQYGVDYVIGRNCRFLQGPNTNPFSIARVREKLNAGMEHYETFLNYRRDGSPFMNLVMLAPLYDSRGAIRYFIGAQVDVSGLAKQSYDLDALKRLTDDDEHQGDGPDRESDAKDEFTQLAETFESRELEIVRQRGGDMHRGRARTEMQPQREGNASRISRESRSHSEAGHHAGNWAKPRVVLRDSESPTEGNAPSNGHISVQLSSAATLATRHNGRLTGVYQHYLLVRPYPSLRILFTSPSMRVPGILQSPLVDRIGGSARMRDDFVQALAQGQGVTAKVRWLNISHGQTTGNSKNRAQRRRQQAANNEHHHPLEAHLDFEDDADEADTEPTGRSRWLHCTPLLGANGKVGVWMIVLVDDDSTLSLRGGGGGGDVNSSSGPSQQQQHLPARPETAMSSHLRTHTPPSVATRRDRRNGADDERRAAESKPKQQQQPQQVRPRKSSETLSSPILSQFPEPGKNGSATSLIHNQHSVSGGQRAPRPLAPLRQRFPQQQQEPPPFQKHMDPTAATTTGLPANFFSLTALSRSSRNKFKSAGRGRSVGVVAAQRDPRQGEQVPVTSRRESMSPSVEVHDAVTAPVADHDDAEATRHWPLSPTGTGQTQSGSRYVYIPPAIEEKSDRGSSRLGDSLETASMQSLGSNYTVRIEE